MNRQHHYSLIKLRPDAERGEIINVGVVVYLQGALDVRVASLSSKLRAIAPNFDDDVLHQLGDLLRQFDSVASANASPAERRDFLNNMGFAVLGPVGFFRCADPQYDASVSTLLQELVLPPVQHMKRERGVTRLETQIRRDLELRGVLGTEYRDIEHHKVVPRYPISAAEHLVADLALKNGRMHFCAVIDFRGKPENVRNQKHRTAALKSVMLDRAVKLYPEAMPMVIMALPDENRDEAEPAVNMLNEYADRVYNFLDAEESQEAISHFVNSAGHSTGAHGVH